MEGEDGFESKEKWSKEDVQKSELDWSVFIESKKDFILALIHPCLVYLSYDSFGKNYLSILQEELSNIDGGIGEKKEKEKECKLPARDHINQTARKLPCTRVT